MSSHELESLKFAEWRILKDNINEFVDVLRSRNGGGTRVTFSAFGVGSPRNCAIIVTAKVGKRTLRKAIIVNITSGDFTNWLAPFDSAEWETVDDF